MSEPKQPRKTRTVTEIPVVLVGSQGEEWSNRLAELSAEAKAALALPEPKPDTRPVVYCEECKHVRLPPGGIEYARCSAVPPVDFVRREPSLSSWRFASSVNRDGHCGLYEAAPPQPPPSDVTKMFVGERPASKRGFWSHLRFWVRGAL